MIEAAFFILGCLFSWSITYFYYKRSSTQVPIWAKPLIANLPKDQPKLGELLKLFQKHLDSGEVIINPILGRVACPECGESAKNFEENSVGDEYHTIVSYTCPTCGWSYSTEI